MPKSISFLRGFSLLWALVVGFLAVALLYSCVTVAGAVFGVASLCIALAPWLLSLDEERVWLRRAGNAGIGLWLLLSMWLVRFTPDGHTPAGSRISNQYVDGRWDYPSHALGAMVPEIDQLLLGFRLMPAVDPFFPRSQARELAALTRGVYQELDADPSFRAVGSAMPHAYDDLWGLGFSRQHYYLYVPAKLDKTKPAPALVFLHGYGGNFKAYTWILSRVADQLGMVVIAPSFGLGHWEPKRGPGVVFNALESAEKMVKVDKEHVCLAGLSNGGLGVCQSEAGLLDSKFRSLVFISPVFDLDAIHSSIFQNRWHGRSVLVISGGRDDRTTPDSVDEGVREMAKVGVAVERKTFADAGHFLFFSHREAMAKELVEWLGKGRADRGS